MGSETRYLEKEIFFFDGEMTAAVRNAGGSVALTNVTAVDSAVGVAHSSGSTAVRNCIVYGNTAQISGSPTVTYSDVEGGFSGTGNMDKDPVFKSPGMEDYHLTVASPCIDAGDPGDSYANEPEPNGGRIDMGAYGNASQAAITIPEAEGISDSQ